MQSRRGNKDDAGCGLHPDRLGSDTRRLTGGAATTAPAPVVAPVIQPPLALRNIDLNVAPGSSLCSPAMDGEQAKGLGEHCSGILRLRS